MNLRKNSAPPAEGVVVDEAGQSASRTRLLVGGGVVAGLAVVGGLSYVLLGGGGDDVPASTVAVTQHPAAQPTSTATTATSAPTIAKFTGSNARDPFKALVVEQAASTGAATASGTTGGAAAAPAATTPATTGTVVVVPTGSPAPVVSTPKPSATKTTTPQAPVYMVALVSVAPDNGSATLTVNNKSYTVKKGQPFATYFRLEFLHNGSFVTIAFGDSTRDVHKGAPIPIS